MIDLWESLVRTIAALAVVLALMGVVTWLARRMLGARGPMAGPAPLVQVLASGYIAPRKSIALVSVAGEYLIVGLTADGIVPLGRLDDPQKIQAVMAQTPPSGGGVNPGAGKGLPEWVQATMDRFRSSPPNRQEG